MRIFKKIFGVVRFLFHKPETEKFQPNQTNLVKTYKITELKKPNQTETKPIIKPIRKSKTKSQKTI
jgi:hypothetical protein